MKPSHIQKKLVREAVFTAVHRYKGEIYKDSFNPYNKESTNFGRFERLYPKITKSYFDFLITLEDMESVYGSCDCDKNNKEI